MIFSFLVSLLPILEFVLMLSFLVIIHELGHFITARLFKIKIEEFGVGYPPTARTLFHWKGIPFTLNWIPIGGFVRMEGEDGTPQEEKESQVAKHIFTPFNTKSAPKRLIVVLAGATVNFLFGVLAFAIIYSRLGIPVVASPAQTVVAVVHDGPAKEAGVQTDDIITHAEEIKGESIDVGDVSAFTTWILQRPDKDIILKIKRGNDMKEMKLHTRSAEQVKTQGALSVELAEPVVATYYPWYRMPFESAKFGLLRSFEFSRLILSGLSHMGSDLIHHGKVPTDVAGPIGIVSQVTKQKVFQGGFLQALDFTAIFSINLAIMNILPIPALDGGRALFILLEYIVGRKRIAKIETRANGIGIVLLLLLIVLISIKDVWILLGLPI